MKKFVASLCLICLLLCSGCAEKSVEEKLRDFYPDATLTVDEEGFWIVKTPIDVSDYERVIYDGASQGHKPVKSLAALRKNYDSNHYVLVKGYRTGGVQMWATFDEEGLNYGSGCCFTVKVTGVFHGNEEEIPEEIYVRGGGVILPHGEQRVLYDSRVPLPEENEEYFFILSQVMIREDLPLFSYFNPLAADLKIDEGLLNAKELTDAQKLTADLMREYLKEGAQ